MSAQVNANKKGGCPLKHQSDFPDISLYGKLITIKIGDKEFSVHREVISYHSAYFRGALTGHFEDGKGDNYTLPADELAEFQTFMGWLYTRRLSSTDNPFDIKKHEAVQALIKAYVFADRRGIPGMNNAIIDLLIDENCEKIRIPLASLRYTWGNLPENDGLRKLFLDWMSMRPVAEKVFERPKQIPPDFAILLLDRVIRPTRRPALRSVPEWLRMKCEYHDHTDAAIGGNQQETEAA